MSRAKRFAVWIVGTMIGNSYAGGRWDDARVALGALSVIIVTMAMLSLIGHWAEDKLHFRRLSR